MSLPTAPPAPPTGDHSGVGHSSWIVRRFDLVFCLLAAAVCLGFVLVTGNIWEDFFITFRHSENLCRGDGLVYEVGQRVHGFTSPLGVLLPALCHWLTGMRSHLHALWAFRLLFAIPGFVIGGLLLVRLVRRTTPEHPLAPLIAGTLYLLEAKSVVFATNGMETGLMLAAFVWALALSVDGLARRWPMLGLAWAAMMWVRPDACVYIAVLGLTAIAYAVPGTRRAALAALLKAAAVTTILYLPWFAWAWWYYGSPVPHTIAAKGALLADRDLWTLLTVTVRKLPYCVFWVFGPVYAQFYSWPITVYVHMVTVGLFSFVYWLLPAAWPDRLGCRASLMFFLVCIYLAYMVFPYPWYYSPAAALGILVLSRGICHLAARMADGKRRRSVALAAGGLVALCAALTFGLVTFQLRLQQRIIEQGVRIPIGKWLATHAAPEDRIYLECLGYVGYFSHGRMVDSMGLVSPEVVRLVREEGLDFYTLPERLQPEWIVLRLGECLRMEATQPYFREQYTMVKVFENSDELDRHLFIPGESFLLYDIFFVVFRRQDAPAL